MGNQISVLQDDHLWLLGKESPLSQAQAQRHITNGLPFQRGQRDGKKDKKIALDGKQI